MLTLPNGYTKIAENESGVLAIVARDSVVTLSGDKNFPAAILYPNGHIGKEWPLQRFFKFGVWKEPT